MSRLGFELPTFLGGDWSHVYYLNFDPPIPKVLKLFVIPDPFKIFRICISWISSNQIWVRWIAYWQWFHGICFTPGCMTVSTFYAKIKTSKMNYAFTSLNGFLFNCPSLIFYNALRFWGIIFSNSMYQATIFFHYSWKCLRYKECSGFFLAEYQMHYLAIFLTK